MSSGTHTPCTPGQSAANHRTNRFKKYAPQNKQINKSNQTKKKKIKNADRGAK
jgi:hypothetical protein